MSSLQNFFSALLPVRWAKSMEAESRSWMVRCACGFQRSVWDLGGIRWKAKGQPRRHLSCPNCGQSTWHTVIREQPAAKDDVA